MADLLDELAGRDPAREFIVVGADRLSYAETRARVRQLAKGLLRLGVKRGDKARPLPPRVNLERTSWLTATLSMRRTVRMVLLIGGWDDPLLRGVATCLAKMKRPTTRLSGTGLSAHTPFAVTTDGRRLRGFVRVKRRVIDLSEISGILLTSTGPWRPRPDVSVDDQAFVFHETLAVWWGILAGLPARVLGPHHVSSWFHDPNYVRALATDLARALHLRDATAESAAPGTAAPAGSRGAVLFVVGDRLIPVTPSATRFLSRITPRRRALRRWQSTQRVYFARLEFGGNDGGEIRRLDLSGSLDGVPASVRAAVAREAARWLAA